MKTKIIYISGSEIFEMADVRAAFEEVRNTLGLGKDTILFGVPVDCDDAMATATTTDAAQPVSAATPVPEQEPTQEQAPESTPEPQPDIPVCVQEEPAPKQAEETVIPQKKSRGRPRKTVVAATPEITADAPADQTDKVIPILSVLASKAAAPVASDTVTEPITIDTPDISETLDEAQEPVEIAETVPVMDTPDVADAEKVENATIEDMIADDAPEVPLEKTLEQLLESMTPLREDHGDMANDDFSDDATAEIADITITESQTRPAGDTDATLEQLAAEFADAEDKLPNPAPTQGIGKIGKLKNILPFKKARRDDTGLMGDLFGWAGVAANDEDFTIPGFFTNAASKK